MKKREVSLPELTLGNKVISPLSLITGVSGSGKSFLRAQANFPKGAVITDLDAIATREGDKWLADIESLRDTDIAVGWTDNLIEVAQTLRDNFEEGAPLTMYWVQPSPAIFRATNAAKAADASGSRGDQWKASWIEKSRYSDQKIEEFLSAKLENLIAKIKPDELVIVRNVDAKGPITIGWHKPKDERSSERTIPISSSNTPEGGNS